MKSKPRDDEEEGKAKQGDVTFSFGENWRAFVDTVSEETIRRAMSDLEDWLGHENIVGKRVLDAGCGSGIHSLCFHRLGAKELVSFDLDSKSIEATRLLWEKAGQPENWRIQTGSVLDKGFLNSLERFDIVYSWGVLHHTGAMWRALSNVCDCVANEGLLWIALYVAGPLYPKHLALKKKYNRASTWVKKAMIAEEVARIIYRRLRNRQNPFAWNTQKERGMNVYHDLIDWLGGLPYEVASAEDVEVFCGARGFILKRLDKEGEGGNHKYLLSLKD